jgi:hypothetical protein
VRTQLNASQASIVRAGPIKQSLSEPDLNAVFMQEESVQTDAVSGGIAFIHRFNIGEAKL